VVALVLLAGCGGSKVPHPASSSGLKGDPLDAKPRAPQIALPDARGQLVRLRDFRGRWVVVTFLYTHCPDVCPLIAQQLNAALARASGLRVVAVSVDPARDTPAAVRRFVRLHRLRPAFHYLIGSPSRLRPVWSAWHVARLPGPKATITHTTFEVLVDPAGRERVYYGSSVKARDVLHDLAELS
jgi:protein SCO1/2